MTPTLRMLAWMLAAAAWVGMHGGCTTYLGRYDYTPRPAEMRFDASGTDARPDARALVSVIGIRRKAAETMDRPGVEIKVRVENLGEAAVRFDPSTVAVVTAGLDRLEKPISPPEPTTLDPGASTIALLRFPLGAGVGAADESMDGFNVRLTLRIAGQRLTHSVGFQRRRDQDARFYYHPYHAYPYGLHYDGRHGFFFYHD